MKAKGMREGRVAWMHPGRHAMHPSEWLPPALGGPRTVQVELIPTCHVCDEPADRTEDQDDDSVKCWCDGCRLEWTAWPGSGAGAEVRRVRG